MRQFCEPVLFGNGMQGFRPDFQINAFHVEQLTKLFDQGIFGLGQNLNQGFFCEFGQGGDHGHTAHQLRNKAELDQIFRLHFGKHLGE